jgi:hypothetical protein
MTTADVTAEVAEAIEEIRADFPDAAITVEPDQQCGARLIVDPVELDSPLYQGTTWVGFYITHPYPYADVYPHYVRPDLVLAGGIATPLHTNHEFLGKPAIMVSRRNNRHNAIADTASLKLRKVVEWLNAQR